MTHIGFVCSMVATKAQLLRVWPMASLSIKVLNQLKFAPAISLLLRNELDVTVGGLRVLNCYWAGEDSMYKFFEMLYSSVHSINLSDEPLTPTGSPSWSTSTGRCKGWHLQAARAMVLERAESFTHNIDGSHCAAWRRCNIFQLYHYRKCKQCL